MRIRGTYFEESVRDFARVRPLTGFRYPIAVRCLSPVEGARIARTADMRLLSLKPVTAPIQLTIPKLGSIEYTNIVKLVFNMAKERSGFFHN